MFKAKFIRDRIQELRSFRYMFFNLVKKKLYGKYKNTVLGFIWNFIVPVLSILVLYVVFDTIRERDFPFFWAYLCIGMFPFSLMSPSITEGAGSITSNANMIKKMYFPMEILPLTQVTYSFIIFSISYIFVAILMVFVGFPLGYGGLLALPLVIITMFIFSLGMMMFVSTITVYIRDLEPLISVFGRSLFWLTPIFYSTDQLTGPLLTLVWMNPLTYYVESFHDILYRGIMPDGSVLIGCVIISLLTLVLGAYTFFKFKDGFVERI